MQFSVRANGLTGHATTVRIGHTLTVARRTRLDGTPYELGPSLPTPAPPVDAPADQPSSEARVAWRRRASTRCPFDVGKIDTPNVGTIAEGVEMLEQAEMPRALGRHPSIVDGLAVQRPPDGIARTAYVQISP
jgi:hypothetical protein